MNNLSYWEYKHFLEGIDHLVVGGGIVGLSTGYYLKKKFPHQRVVVVERDVFSAGASSKNAGFACFGSPSELASDFKSMPEHEVVDLVQMRFEGLGLLRNLLGDEAIGFKPEGGVELFRIEDRKNAEYCLSQLDLWNSMLEDVIGFRPYEPSSAYLAFSGKQSFHYSIAIQGEGSIQTGMMLRTLRIKAASIGVETFNGFPVESISLEGKRPVVKYLGTDVRPEKLYICTNGFAKELLPSLEVSAVRNQVIVTSPLQTILPEGTFHVDEGYVYFRAIEKRLLIGGFRNLDITGETTSQFGITEKIQNELELFIRNYITEEELNIAYRWSGILGVGPTKLPILERVSDRLYIGVRMGGMGVAIGNLIGKKLSELSV